MSYNGMPLFFLQCNNILHTYSLYLYKYLFSNILH